MGLFFSNIAYTSPFLHHECISLVYPYTLFPSSLRLSARMASEGSELPRCRGSLASRTKLRKHFCGLYFTDWYILMISKPWLMYHISDGVAISSCHARIPHPGTSNRGSFFWETEWEIFMILYVWTWCMISRDWPRVKTEAYFRKILIRSHIRMT